jgi:hypothetical protein
LGEARNLEGSKKQSFFGSSTASKKPDNRGKRAAALND